ncbi:hypothetical protein ACH4F6_11470 [Streptomyces sp. NPDC017936]|uniref:hypothetical protein n=1 Tax=Streptomyces sp. NPDC017936 TaxID=3365016 RepID=UPI0037A46D76
MTAVGSRDAPDADGTLVRAPHADVADEAWGRRRPRRPRAAGVRAELRTLLPRTRRTADDVGGERSGRIQ